MEGRGETGGEAYQSGSCGALYVLHDAVVDGAAAADSKHEYSQQYADCSDCPSSPPSWLAGLGPNLFAIWPALSLA